MGRRERIGGNMSEITISESTYRKMVEDSVRLDLLKQFIKTKDLRYIKDFGGKDLLEVSESARVIIGYEDDEDVILALQERDKKNEETDTEVD
jgi:hypothetical protein